MPHWKFHHAEPGAESSAESDKTLGSVPYVLCNEKDPAIGLSITGGGVVSASGGLEVGGALMKGIDERAVKEQQALDASLAGGGLRVLGNAYLQKDLKVTNSATLGEATIERGLKVSGQIFAGSQVASPAADLGLYSMESKNWLRFVTNDGPILFFTTTEGAKGGDQKAHASLRIEGNEIQTKGKLSVGSDIQITGKLSFGENAPWISSSGAGNISLPIAVAMMEKLLPRVKFKANGKYMALDRNNQVHMSEAGATFLLVNQGINAWAIREATSGKFLSWGEKASDGLRVIKAAKDTIGAGEIFGIIYVEDWMPPSGNVEAKIYVPAGNDGSGRVSWSRTNEVRVRDTSDTFSMERVL
jgi:hypothetical protein